MIGDLSILYKWILAGGVALRGASKIINVPSALYVMRLSCGRDLDRPWKVRPPGWPLGTFDDSYGEATMILGDGSTCTAGADIRT